MKKQNIVKKPRLKLTKYKGTLGYAMSNIKEVLDKKEFEKFREYKQLAVHYIWEDLWWKRKNANIPWLEKLIRI